MALDLKTIRCMTEEIAKDKEKEAARKKAVEGQLYSQLAEVSRKLARHREQVETKKNFEQDRYSYGFPMLKPLVKELRKSEEDLSACTRRINSECKEHGQNDEVTARHQEELSRCQKRVAQAQQAHKKYLKRLRYPGLLNDTEFQETQMMFDELNTLYIAVGLASICGNCKKARNYGDQHGDSEESGYGTCTFRYRC